ncbi:MAG: toll/interleukin-1 receptor domain-containing protein [Candidatus Aminicenantes bacterium]|nr:toll/interleukin-1 receptor domain-containing protein [Candidatus Aminicenantes bacterium]
MTKSKENTIGKLKGFWSYVHSDNKAEGGRIITLANDIIEQYQMITGEEITLFLDKDIKWGEEWRKTIDDNLASVVFFIPVVTPRYFLSAGCRREMQEFTRKATNLGTRELVLPLYYVDVPSLHEESEQDDLIKIVRDFQWEDWRDIRFKETVSEGYRRGVSQLAKRLVDVNRRLEKQGTMVIPPEKSEMLVEIISDESPGVLDRLAKSEETLPELSSTLALITSEILQIGKIMQDGTSDIKRSDSQSKGFTGRLIVARQMSQKLNEPVEHIFKLSNNYSTQLHDVDEGIRLMLEQAFTEIKEAPELKSKFINFFESVEKLSAAAKIGLGATEKMIDASRPIESMSRDMRPVMRRLRQGLTILVESRDITDDWMKLIESHNKIVKE